MRHAFNLDALVTHDLEPLDPAPDRIDDCLAQDRDPDQEDPGRPGRLRNRIVEITGCEIRAERDTKETVKALTVEIDDLKQRRGTTPKHVRAGDLTETDKLDTLPTCDANIRPEPENGILRVRIPGGLIPMFGPLFFLRR